MPKSRTRVHVHHQPQVHKHKKPASAVLKITFILLLIGLAIGALGSGFNMKWMAISTLTGALGGFLIGLAVDRAAAKKHYND